MRIVERSKFGLNEALAQIEGIRAQLYSMGNNDEEFSNIDVIIKDLNDSKITPQEAVSKAQAVMDSKIMR